MKSFVQTWLNQERLPESYVANIFKFYLPYAEELVTRIAANQDHKPYFVGVSGSYGSGKSTLCSFLTYYLRSKEITSIAVSIDDFYLTKEARRNLSETIHPLLKTRGVPGTHDLNLWAKFYQDVKNSHTVDSVVKVPFFEKQNDDRASMNSWREVKGPVDVLFLDGWCVGIPSLSTILHKGLITRLPEDLRNPINELERNEDPDGTWRKYVETQLQELERIIFCRFDEVVFLRVANFAAVLRNRNVQEENLKAKLLANNMDISKIMTTEQVERFVQFPERLTRRSFQFYDMFANTVFMLDENQNVISRESHIKL